MTDQGWSWELGFFIFSTAHHNIINTYINDSVEDYSLDRISWFLAVWKRKGDDFCPKQNVHI